MKSIFFRFAVYNNCPIFGSMSLFIICLMLFGIIGCGERQSSESSASVEQKQRASSRPKSASGLLKKINTGSSLDRNDVEYLLSVVDTDEADSNWVMSVPTLSLVTDRSILSYDELSDTFLRASIRRKTNDRSYLAGFLRSWLDLPIPKESAISQSLVKSSLRRELDGKSVYDGIESKISKIAKSKDIQERIFLIELLTHPSFRNEQDFEIAIQTVGVLKQTTKDGELKLWIYVEKVIQGMREKSKA